MMALKCYMDKLYKFEKSRWEAPLLQYVDLSEEDNNFVQAYDISYTQVDGNDTTGRELETLVKDVTSALKYGKCKQVDIFDFRNHLYFPLISVSSGNMKIQISPVALNEGERLFIQRMQDYVKNHSDKLEGKALYLLRNKSKVGMGFFEAGNFFPDFILWIDTPEIQYISFIDPKGLLMVSAHNPKVQFYKNIKTLETQLAPTSEGKTVVLNSFIMSETPAVLLKEKWGMSLEEREAINVYTLDNSTCVKKMMDKILLPPTC